MVNCSRNPVSKQKFTISEVPPIPSLRYCIYRTSMITQCFLQYAVCLENRALYLGASFVITSGVWHSVTGCHIGFKWTPWVINQFYWTYFLLIYVNDIHTLICELPNFNRNNCKQHNIFVSHLYTKKQILWIQVRSSQLHMQHIKSTHGNQC